MIPIKLCLRNFLCYKDNVPPLSFEGIHLACLCGENGAGKSALLDAITWALWGEARGKSNDELVYTGQRDMEVELEFESGGKRYRVIRKFSKSAPGQPPRTLLELQIASDHTFLSISGDNLRQTQRKIERDILHMDYQTFINSAFLLQGRADEFTTKTPAQRKEILGQILGLSIYEELEQRAKDRMKEKRNEQEKLKPIIAEMEEELARRPQYENEREETQIKVTQLMKEVEKEEIELHKLQERKQRLEFKRERLQELERGLEGLRKELSYWQQEIREKNQRLKEYEDILAQKAKVEEGYNHFLKAKREEEELSSKLWQLHPLEQEKIDIEARIQRIRAQWGKERELALQRLTECQSKGERLPQLEQTRQSLLQELTQLEEEEKRKKGIEETYQTVLNSLSILNAKKEQLNKEGEALQQKRELLVRGEERCPLCQTPLGEEGIERLRLKYQEEGLSIKETLSYTEQEIETQQRELDSLRSQVSELGAKINNKRPQLQGNLFALNKEIEEAKTALSEIHMLKEKLQQIEEGSIKAELSQQQELIKIERQIEAIGYSRERHGEVRKEMELWKDYEGQKKRLEEAERLIHSVKSDLEKASQSYNAKLAQIEEGEREGEVLNAELALLPQVEKDLQASEQSFRELKGKLEEEKRRLWEAEERIRNCQELESKRRQREEEMNQLAVEERVYEELAEAFGKRGIQALLIEQALPQLFEEADGLLKRLTNDRMSLNFKTERLTKEGKIIETLEIIISDELGTRSYEMYSGGETFRIDFALRVALARLVAKRAGVPLSTLIIDEGFGSQDTIGRENLVEAINTVARDFDKVLVVTHIDEIKERFPVRIEVTKTEEGSVFRII